MAAPNNSSRLNVVALLPLTVFTTLLQCSMGARSLAALVEQQPLVLAYHKGDLLTGPISINLVWYGSFTPPQRAVVTDFVTSLSSSKTRAGARQQQQPSVATWWRTVEKYYRRANSHFPIVSAGTQSLDESYSLGKRLTSSQIASLAARGGKAGPGAINVLLTADDVAVDGFCMSRCGTHGSSSGSGSKKKSGRYAYIWVGNSATQCPGQCAWPFHQPRYGPQVPPLVAPNGDVGVDGMVINLASLLAGTATNPFGKGYFQGNSGAQLEAASACTGVYGKGAYPGYPGKLLVDETTGGSYNAVGENGRKFLLPAIVDPDTSSCSTLV